MFIKIGEILNSHSGTKFQKEVDIALEKVEDFTLDKNQKMEFEIYRVPHGLAVLIPEQTIGGQAICGRTLEAFTTEITTTPTETRFYIEVPEHEDLEEYQMINHKSGEIDLEPVLNEAILLSIPSVFYKPGSKPLNKIDNSGNQPFKNLKDLF